MKPLDTLYTSYKSGKLAPMVLWQGMEKLAASRVKKWLKWDDPEVIGNAVSKAFLAIEAGKFKDTALFSTWFIRFVDTECFMTRRTKLRHPTVPLESSHWESLKTENTNADLYDTIDALPLNLRRLILLKLEGFSESQIAERISVPRKIVHSGLLNALRKLKELMKNAK